MYLCGMLGEDPLPGAPCHGMGNGLQRAPGIQTSGVKKMSAVIVISCYSPGIGRYCCLVVAPGLRKTRCTLMYVQYF